MFRFMSIRAKIFLLSLLAAMGMAAFAPLYIVNTAYLEEARQDKDQSQQMLQRVDTIYISFLELRRVEQDLIKALERGEQDVFNEVLVRHDKIDEALQRDSLLLHKQLIGDSFFAEAEEIKAELELLDRFNQILIERLSLAAFADDAVERSQIQSALYTDIGELQGSIDRTFQTIRFILAELRDGADARTKDAGQRYEQIRTNTTSTSVMASLVIVIGVTAFGVWMGGAISGRINKIASDMTALAEGHTDIDVSAGDGKDEIGALAGAFRVFRDNAIGLVESNMRFQQMADNIHEVFWVTSPDKKEMIYVSPAYEEIWGRSCVSLYERPDSFLDAIHPDDRDRVRHATTHQTEGRYDEQYRILHKDGEERWVRDLAYPIRDKDGNVTRIVGVAEDITDIKEAELALRVANEELEQRVARRTRQLEEKKNLLETVLESMGQGIVAFDNDLKLAAWNKHFLDIRDYPRDLAVEGRDFADFMEWDARHDEFGDEDPEQEVQLQVSRAGKFLPHHFERQRPNGTFIEVQGGPIPGGGFVSTFTDITQRKEWELATTEARERAEAANVRLQELDQLKSMFIASMSHELRTPLNSIIGFTGVILQGMSGDLTDSQKDQLGRVYRSAKHLLALISDVIDISKVEAGRVELYGEDFTLSELIDEAIESIRPQLEEKHLACEINVPQGIRMHTDRRRLLQCTLNYLSNAVKYTETGKITVSAVDLGDSVEISVSDTGIGIPEDELDRVFMPFERIDSHLRVRTPGTGLGLYLTKKLAVEMFHGSVSVTSRVGEGSTFVMVVQKASDHDTALADGSKGRP